MFSINLSDEMTSTHSTSASLLKTEESFSSKQLEKERLRSQFKKELCKIGLSEKQLMDRNPVKNISRDNSPEDSRGLPFQRRARSNSP